MRTLRPIWVAEELGLRYEHRPIGPRTGETQTAAYTRLNPKQKVPLLQDGDLALTESVAMCRYLIERYGREGTLHWPADTIRRARLDEWICYLYGELDETSLYVMRRHRDLPDIYGAAPAAVSSSQAYAARHLGIIASQLGARDHLLDGGFSLADLVLVTCLDWAVHYEFELPSALVSYRAQHTERPAYRAAFAINYGRRSPPES